MKITGINFEGKILNVYVAESGASFAIEDVESENLYAALRDIESDVREIIDVVTNCIGFSLMPGEKEEATSDV